MRSLPVPVALAVCILSRATWQVATKPVNHVEDYIGRKGIPTINDQAVYDASYRITSFTQVHCQLARAKA
ncbi:hypothetical protein DPMN_035072 [Dreissena polymorpha]|uniref:Uncharacterized protein n=1 Tax=Dreissena polymorpha TaxID=45954 RepID=A0A9D4MA81_DREPO|nr:hypothetical protein DPMN_035072 [Dreissena polymorpha]